ncbi:DEAD/DEAH box helicase [Candidatus Poriferisodalis sp.]|uniref:DEAD/DEAH box helicase n=1 Tax=Candidatus Poriferisodalis sp. TaxID=3101277 RepID=UPI003B0124E7
MSALRHVPAMKRAYVRPWPDSDVVLAQLEHRGEWGFLNICYEQHTEIAVPSGDRRLVAAVLELIANDAAVARKVRGLREGTLEWTFNCAPGHERDYDRALRRVVPLLLPRRVQDSLYPFQRSGTGFLLQRNRAVLADDMGLGKTVQVIAAIRRLYRARRLRTCLVAAPRTLIANWDAEFHRWAPELTVLGLDRLGGGFADSDWHRAAARAHAVLASYEDVRDLWRHLARQPPSLIVADEAHRLRKSDSQLSQAMRRLVTPRLWMLTGTPVERDAADLACLLSLLEPRLYSIDDDRLGLETMRARARPYLLRRTKESVLPELPTAVEHTVECEMLPAQRAAYNEAIRSLSSSGPGDFLALFGRLRTICDWEPVSGDSAKLDRASGLVQAAAARGRKTVVFSFTIDPLRQLSERLRRSGIGCQLLIGEQSLAVRERAIAKFKSDPECFALAASMRVGSEGLTLTEATQVVFINRWWNPSANAQAVDRVVRIGQTQPVDVHYLTCANTVEDRLQPMLDRKSLTFDELIDRLRHDRQLVADLLH